MKFIQLLAIAGLAAADVPSDCPAYDNYAAQRHPPYSSGKWKYPYQRPESRCRSYVVPEVEQTLSKVKRMIKDTDLYSLFVNTWPNTVDTTILWHGKALDNPDEELAFVTTGDIHAMWLRDSANQLQSYKPILNITSHNSTNNIASLYRGTINLQSRYIRKFPYCNAFQPPPDSKLPPNNHKRSLLAKRGDTVNPPYDPKVVWECKYELDSLSAFLQLSWDYYDVTRDAKFFRKYKWADTVKTILKLANDMMIGTYTQDGRVNNSPYTWLRDANSATETVSNRGTGNPVAGNIGLVRSFFRPSDDSTIYQYFIPANMMFARYLHACAEIMHKIDRNTASQMSEMARGIEHAIDKYGIVEHPKFGDIYAYEVDGLGSHNLMDDANIPSLLSIPHLGFKSNTDRIYRHTRDFVLSRYNPYFGFGPVLNATGGPHLGPGMAWPMGVIMQTMTSHDDHEIVRGIKQLMGATSGLGLIHESVNTHDDTKWTRSWFAWANGLFGQMILDLLDRKPHLLARSYQ
ncbi:hypothetical protein VFPPC_01442 [Pochonia chlamydosporia 170]|uniref:DUF1237 domain-containing protein n=1 Tax=Pochonia chlamydosporia 170 TaxID=1380566 RepID=A0A179G7Q6_METCM|nr:hypothetical protein VFPPC_01442 [Pochonia chlamydosporia 170]OAQ73827.1 hypothetical protein VFPPC_01442 [Pochonia chlamydosporia 170]